MPYIVLEWAFGINNYEKSLVRVVVNKVLLHVRWLFLKH